MDASLTAGRTPAAYEPTVRSDNPARGDQPFGRPRQAGGDVQDLSPDPSTLDPIETASRDELAALQLERLQAALKHAYANVPHYRQAFDAAGVHPDDCRSLADLPRFPFTTKQDLRDNYPFGMFAVPREQVSRVHASSGTTGRPTVVGYTRTDIDTWSQLMARSIRAAGGRPGHVEHVAYGYGLFTGGLGAHYGAEALGCTVVPVSGGMTERQVLLIRDFRPDVIMVTRRTCSRSWTRWSARASTPARRRSRSASSVRSRGPMTCAASWSNGSTCTPSTSTGSPRSWAPASRWSASRPRTACTSGRTTSIRRS